MVRNSTKKHGFTLIEMIVVVILLTVIAGASVHFVVDIARTSIALQQAARESTDVQFLLLRVSKEVSPFGQVTSVAADNKSLQMNGGGSISWDSSTKALSIDGTAVHADVSHFNVTRTDQQLDVSISVGNGPIISTAVFLRE